MEKTEQRIRTISNLIEKNINRAEYLDYTKNFEPAEINNISQELFKKDFESR